MKNTLILIVVFVLGAAIGISGILQSVADETKEGIEAEEASTIRFVEDTDDLKTEEGANAPKDENAPQDANAPEDESNSKDVKAEEKEKNDSNPEEAETAEPAESAAKTYWVGAVIGPIPEEILAHLAEGLIPEGKGICVMEIIPDSPAEISGLKVFDVIVKVDGEVINSADFSEKVKTSEGKKLALEVHRAAQTLNIEVTPTEHLTMPQDTEGRRSPGGRKLEFRYYGEPEMEFDDEDYDYDYDYEGEFQIPKQMLEIFKQPRDMKKRGGSGFHEGHGPNIAVPKRRHSTPDMESHGAEMTRSMTMMRDGKRLTITITQYDDEPANVSVEWKGKHYETTSDRLNVIPEEIRDIVEDFILSTDMSIPSDKSATQPLAPPDAEGEKKAPERREEIPLRQDNMYDLN